MYIIDKSCISIIESRPLLPLTAVGLVRLVRAVWLLVAPPVRRDAARVVELVLGARELAGVAVWRGWKTEEGRTEIRKWRLALFTAHSVYRVIHLL